MERQCNLMDRQDFALTYRAGDAKCSPQFGFFPTYMELGETEFIACI